MSEIQRLVWLMSMPICVQMNNAMQEYIAVTYTTSEQHKYTTSATLERGSKDKQAILNFLNKHNPFNEEESLHNIVTGVTATSKVNAHEAEPVGDLIISTMANKYVSSYTFRRKNQIVTMTNIS